LKTRLPIHWLLSLGICMVLLLTGLVSPRHSYGWASKLKRLSHQYIVTTACDLLKNDPVGKEKRFPECEAILANEGAKGPDGEGNSPYSYHYYNPVLKIGDGPKQASVEYENLARGLATNSLSGMDKAAAWAQHYLADMHVPFHTLGMYADDALAKYPDGQIDDQRVYGGTRFCAACGTVATWQAEKGDFSWSLSAFKDAKKAAKAAGHDDLNWFDPWLYNGTLPFEHYEGTSSHVYWEAVSYVPTYTLEGFEINWENAPAAFDATAPWTKQGAAVEQLAIAAATYARTADLSRFSYLLQKAIRAVYTMYRASISGLTPAIAVKETEEGYDIGLTVNNIEPRADAQNVQTRFTVTGNGCKRVKGDESSSLATRIGKNGTFESTKDFWKVEAPDGACKVWVEVIGSYEDVPDLQYALTTQDLPQHKKRPKITIAGRDEAVIGETIRLGATVSPEPEQGTRLKWSVKPAATITATDEGKSAIFVAAQRGQQTISVDLIGPGDKVLSYAFHFIDVSDSDLLVACPEKPAVLGAPVQFSAGFKSQSPEGAKDIKFKWYDAATGKPIPVPEGQPNQRITLKAEPAGKFRIKAAAYGTIPGKAGETKLAEGACSFAVAELFLSTVNIHAVSDKSENIKSAKVTFKNSGPAGMTDENGKAAFSKVQSGNYTVVAEAPGFAPASQDLKLDPKNAEESEKPINLKLVLVPSVSFTAVAVDKESGKKVGGGFLFKASGPQPASGQATNGEYRFVNMQPGFYKVEALADGWASDEVAMTLDPARQTGLGEVHNIPVYPAARVKVWIFGTKTKNLDGKPVNQPEPGWISLDGHPYEFAGTGTFLFEKVTRGRHSFYGLATGFDVATKQTDIDPSNNKYYELSIQLTPAFTLRIEPRDSEQKNTIIRNASGVLADEKGSTFRSNTTTGGTILFTKLHEGIHSIRLRADGYEDYLYNAVRITKPDEMLAAYMTPKARISVTIEGCPQQMVPGQKAALSAHATTDRGVQPSGLVFRWTDNGQVADRQAIAVAYKQAGTHPVKLEAWAPDQSTGKTEKVAESVCTISVKEQEPARASLAISGGGVRIKPGQHANLAAQVNTNVPVGALTITWVLNNSRVGSSPSYIFSSANPGTYYPAAEVWMNNEGKMYRLAAASATVIVEAQQQPQPKVQQEQPKPLEKKPDAPSQPPPSRTFEQLSDKEKQGVLNCLCKCNSTGTSAVSISYDPKPSNASPHCAQGSNGPCINQGFGCWRHVPDGGSKCAQDCYKSANVTGVPDSVLNAGKDNASADQKKVEAQTKQYEECVQSDKNRLDGAQKELTKVGQKDAPMWFRCGDIGTNWQMIPSKTCCDPFRRDSEKNMEAAAAALQRCGWNEEIQKRQTDYNKTVDACKKKYPSAKQ
jgi:hypothetical protein